MTGYELLEFLKLDQSMSAKDLVQETRSLIETISSDRRRYRLVKELYDEITQEAISNNICPECGEDLHIEPTPFRYSDKIEPPSPQRYICNNCYWEMDYIYNNWMA